MNHPGSTAALATALPVILVAMTVVTGLPDRWQRWLLVGVALESAWALYHRFRVRREPSSPAAE